MSLRSAARWWFADRRTGRLVVAQPPNALASVSSVAAVSSLVLPGPAGRAARVVGEVAAVAWGLDEALRGVNPWRRTLGGATLAVQAWRAAHR